MRLSRRMGNGEATATYLSKGMSVGEIELLVDGLDGARFTVSSVGYGELVRIAGSDLFEVHRATPPSEQELWRQAVAHIKETGSRIGDPGSSEFIEFALDKGLVEGNSILVMNLDVCTRCDDCVRACADTHGGRPRFVREGNRYENLLIAQILLSLPRIRCVWSVARPAPFGAPTSGRSWRSRSRSASDARPATTTARYDAIVMHDTDTDVGGRRVAEGAAGYARAPSPASATFAIPRPPARPACATVPITAPSASVR